MSRSTLPPTAYADSERALYGSIESDHQMFREMEAFSELLEGTAYPILILNAFRQVVYANAAALRFLKEESPSDVLGFRLGEIFHCPHAAEHIGGCGTTVECRSCNVVNGVLAALEGNPVKKECRIEGRMGREKNLPLFRRPGHPFPLPGASLRLRVAGEKEIRLGPRALPEAQGS